MSTVETLWPKTPIWDKTFGPSFTPEEILEMGVFEGIYTAAIEGLPDAWYKKERVLPRGAKPNPALNYYGVKSRLSLKEWQKKGWTTEHSPLGWFQWYCLYFLGRRIPSEDPNQIARWRSFVARHQAQVSKNCRPNDNKCRPVQRQGLLQWAWNSEQHFLPSTVTTNAKRVAGLAGTKAI